jgi:superfamily II DNA or RNA helicase
MPAKILDNSIDRYQLKTTIQQLLISNQCTQISIATGYWDLPGMVEIFSELSGYLEKNNVTFRLLLGEEPYVRTYQLKEPKKQDPNFPQKYLKTDLEELELKSEYQKVTALISKYLNNEAINSKFQIKVYKKNFLHAKCYIFGSEEENAIGIIGSSNFTKKGLTDNSELNHLEDNNGTVNYRRLNINQHPSHRSWFEDLWNNSEDWNNFFKQELLDVSKHGSVCYSPYEMYVHSLYRIYYQDLLDEKEVFIGESEDSSLPKLLDFQMQNANSLIKKLERQSVAMLSDSVGLGKTYTAIKVIEYYKNILNQRVVVIAPAGLLPQWQRAISKFNLQVDLLSIQNTNYINEFKETTKAYSVGLFVIDESHNLRSVNGIGWETIIKWRIESKNSKVLMLTATPINNQLSDLTNQITLGTGGDIKKLGKFYDRSKQRYFYFKDRLDEIQKEIKRQLNQSQKVDFEKIKEQLIPLLNKVVVRRTRQGITKEYPDGLEINGKLQKFPEAYPDNITYQVQSQLKSKLLEVAQTETEILSSYKYTIVSLADSDYLRHPFDLYEYCTERNKPIDSSLEIIYTSVLTFGFPCYRYNIYRKAYYGKKTDSDDLKNATANSLLSRQIGMYGIFRTIFLKRLESSLYSIQLSIKTYKKKLVEFEKYLVEKGKIISVKDLKAFNKFLLDYNDNSTNDDMLDKALSDFENESVDTEIIEADSTVFNLDALKKDIKRDFALIETLEAQLEILIKKDNKIQQLADKLNEYDTSKVLVFSYFADTVKYLQENLPKRLLHNQSIEFALGSKTEIEYKAKRFAPVAKEYEMKLEDEPIQILVATDKLSEGQNLQDCGTIINYDLHWNPVRMIQRNGRINRIGSPHKEIFVYNFRPHEELESYLELVKKLTTKIDLIRYTIGNDQSVLDEEPVPQQFIEDLYSGDEAKRKEAFEKIMQSSEMLAIDDLFMEDLRAFDKDKNFTDDYKVQIREMPKGKWGKIMNYSENTDANTVAHIVDDNDNAGFFIKFKDGSPQGEGIATTEGLLLLRTSPDHNQRFLDYFVNKIETHTTIDNYIQAAVIKSDERPIVYNTNHTLAINAVLQRMLHFQYSMQIVEHCRESIYFNQNTYTKKLIAETLREVRKCLDTNTPITATLVDKLIKASKDFTKQNNNIPAQLKECVQVFSSQIK